MKTDRTANAPAGPDAYKPIKFLCLRDVLARMTISRSLLYELIKDPDIPFPPPVHIRRRSVWLEHEVERYLKNLVDTQRS